VTLHRITKFYSEWFSVCPNITSIFCIIALFKSSVKEVFYLYRLGLSLTLVIIQNEELRRKVLSFNEENNLKRLNRDPTSKFQKNVRDVIKTCNTIIDKANKYKYIQIKPQAPKLNITVKLHKEKNPI
jgi:hypothetical protein